MNVIYVLLNISLIIFFFSYPRDIIKVKYVSFIATLLLFIMSIFLWIEFNPFEKTFQFHLLLGEVNFSMYFGLDGVSLLFIFLTTFLFPVCILFNWDNVYKIKHEFYSIMLSIELLLLVIFTTQNILFFYICFEILLMPLFILIGINSFKKRRIHASFLLFLYTLLGSLFMLIVILYLFSNTGSFNYYVLYNSNIHFNIQKTLWIFLFFSLSVKIPLFPFHIWLPEAHVEASTEGSILLAGVVLKLGVYGFLRILIPIFYEATLYYLPLVYTLISISGIYASFATLRQIDIKRIIAYSSIAHMSIGLFGIFTLKPIGVIGSLLLMFSHGIVSGGLFLLIGFLYSRFKTKNILYFNGLVQLMPLFVTCFFFLILGNISFPGTSSFIGESLIILDVISNYVGVVFFISIILFICTLYSLLTFNKVSFGLVDPNKLTNTFDLTRKEIHLILPFLLLMLWMGIYPRPFITLLESSVYFLTFLQ